MFKSSGSNHLSQDQGKFKSRSAQAGSSQGGLKSGSGPAQARLKLVPPQLRWWLAASCAAVIGACSCGPSGIVEALWLLPAIPIVPGADPPDPLRLGPALSECPIRVTRLLPASLRRHRELPLRQSSASHVVIM